MHANAAAHWQYTHSADKEKQKKTNKLRANNALSSRDGLPRHSAVRVRVVRVAKVAFAQVARP
jgi:hypothetical protein